MNANASDTALLYAWQRNRDASAFHIIVSRHARLVYNTCRHIVRNDADAADVAQECFLSLATTPPNIDRSLAGWLHRLATHRSLNHLKKQKRRRDREVRYARELPDLLHPETDDLLSLIDEAIDALPDELRIPLVDHFFSRRSHQEVAIELGVPRRTVSYRINSGIEQLRTTLSKRGVTEPMAGLIALLEWQRVEAEALPEALHATLSKYALAGATSRGLRGVQRAAFVVSGMSGTILLTIVAVLALCLVLWLVPRGSIAAAPKDTPVVTVEVENKEASEGLASLQDNTAKEAEIERAAAAEPMAAMAGKVTGRVYDADTDAPIAGAQIKIAKDTDTYNPVATCTTDADGNYMSDELPPGAYMIYRGKTPGYGATSEKTFDKTKKFPTHEMEGIRFRLAENTTIDLPVRKGLVVSGVVIDKFGNGIPGVEVSGQTRVQNNCQTTKTDETGAFYLAGFSNTGDFCLTAHKQGLGRKNYTRLDLAYPGLDNLRIELPTAAHVSGSVVDMDGSPVVGAKVIAVHVDSIIRWPLDFPEARTNSQGHYTIEDLGPSQYAIYAYPKSYNQSQNANSTMVEVTGGDHVTNADIKIVDAPGFKVSGIVTDFDGNPIPNGPVSLGPRDTNTITDAAGRFSMNVSSEGEYQPHAGVSGYHIVVPPRQQIVDINSPAGGDSRMEGRININSDRNDLHIQLKENTFTLTGRVIASDSGEPIPYFELSTLSGNGIPGNAEGWQGAQRIYTEDGSFRLEKMPLDPGPYTVYVVAPGHGMGVTDLMIPANATEADATVTILAHPAISGVVVDNKGQPVAGADVFSERTPLEICVATTAADGTFSATGVPLESGMLVAFHPKYPPAASAIPQNPQESEMRFQFQPAGEVAVHITRNGKPASMATVSVDRDPFFPAPAPAAIGLSQKVTNCDGTVRFMGLPVGQIDVKATATARWGEGLSKSQTVAISADKTTEVNIDLSGGSASIRGTFLHNGEPLYQGSVGYRIDTAGDELNFSQMANQGDGIWEFSEVPPGVGTLRFFTQSEDGNIERLVTVELAESEVKIIDIDEGSPTDGEEYASLHGVTLIEGIPLRYTEVMYEVLSDDTTLRYTTASDSSTGEWNLMDVISGRGVITVNARDSEGMQYEHVEELTLVPSESKSMEINEVTPIFWTGAK